MDIKNPFSKIREVKSENKLITTTALFTENNPHGYFSIKELTSYVTGISEYQQKKLCLFFEYLGSGYPISNLPIPMEDTYGNTILWVKFNLPQGKQSFRMHHSDWIEKLVKDYTAGKLRNFRFSVEEMAEELKKEVK